MRGSAVARSRLRIPRSQEGREVSSWLGGLEDSRVVLPSIHPLAHAPQGQHSRQFPQKRPEGAFSPSGGC